VEFVAIKLKIESVKLKLFHAIKMSTILSLLILNRVELILCLAATFYQKRKFPHHVTICPNHRTKLRAVHKVQHGGEGGGGGDGGDSGKKEGGAAV